MLARQVAATAPKQQVLNDDQPKLSLEVAAAYTAAPKHTPNTTRLRSSPTNAPTSSCLPPCLPQSLFRPAPPTHIPNPTPHTLSSTCTFPHPLTNQQTACCVSASVRAGQHRPWTTWRSGISGMVTWCRLRGVCVVRWCGCCLCHSPRGQAAGCPAAEGTVVAAGCLCCVQAYCDLVQQRSGQQHQQQVHGAWLRLTCLAAAVCVSWQLLACVSLTGGCWCVHCCCCTVAVVQE